MPGDKVSVSTTLANNDPNHRGNPAAVDMTKAPRHITFGYGLHRCVGSALAPILQPINLPLEWNTGE